MVTRLSKNNPNGIPANAQKLRLQWVDEGLTIPDKSTVPIYLGKVIRKAIKDGKLIAANRDPLLSANAAFEHAIKTIGGDRTPGKWVDHYGRVGDILISEPYEEVFDETSQRNLQKFCEIFNLDYEVSEKSYHFPERTIRISIFRK